MKRMSGRNKERKNRSPTGRQLGRRKQDEGVTKQKAKEVSPLLLDEKKKSCWRRKKILMKTLVNFERKETDDGEEKQEGRKDVKKTPFSEDESRERRQRQFCLGLREKEVNTV